MGCNFYLRKKEPDVYSKPLREVVKWEYEELVEDGDAEVRMADHRAVHIAKTSWGWVPSFQHVPADRAFDETEANNDMYSISSVADIRGYMETGLYEIVSEEGDVYDWPAFEKRVCRWVENMREHGLEGEPRSHIGSGDSIDSYADPEGYQFCRVCFC